MSRKEMPGWHYLGEGTFNCVYQGTINGSPVVYKVAKTFTSNPSYKSTVVMDIPSRSVRLWDEINPDLLPTACLYREGWIAPFVEGSKPAALEVCDALIELYQRTGRIVVDAISSGNFKKNKSGNLRRLARSQRKKIQNQRYEKWEGKIFEFFRDPKVQQSTKLHLLQTL